MSLQNRMTLSAYFSADLVGPVTIMIWSLTSSPMFMVLGKFLCFHLCKQGSSVLLSATEMVQMKNVKVKGLIASW